MQGFEVKKFPEQKDEQEARLLFVSFFFRFVPDFFFHLFPANGELSVYDERAGRSPHPFLSFYLASLSSLSIRE